MYHHRPIILNFRPTFATLPVLETSISNSFRPFPNDSPLSTSRLLPMIHKEREGANCETEWRFEGDSSDQVGDQESQLLPGTGIM